ncbi:putative holin [Pseudomonas entomophila]|uniref:putative holin n=1 Tax=Pseudomonas entomophila TaxID=312306 RepID=UPI002158CA75|nr:putative holin [Pseudomonas entomophila]
MEFGALKSGDDVMNSDSEQAARTFETAQTLVNVTGFDGNALFGAVLGAWLVSSSRHRVKAWMMISSRKRLKAWQQVGSLMMSAGVGYLFTPLVEALAPLLSSGMAAFVAAVVVIPISVKIMVWLDTADLRDLFQRWRKG